MYSEGDPNRARASGEASTIFSLNDTLPEAHSPPNIDSGSPLADEIQFADSRTATGLEYVREALRRLPLVGRQNSGEEQTQESQAPHPQTYLDQIRQVMFSEPEGVWQRLNVRRQLRRVQLLQSEESETATLSHDEQRTRYKACIRKLSLIKEAAEGYARWKAGKYWDPAAARGDIKRSNEYEFEREKALSGLFQLETIGTLSEEDRTSMLAAFENWWGETGAEYKSLYRKVKRQLQEEQASQANGEINKAVVMSAGGILADKHIPVPTKIQLLRAAGYSNEDIEKIVWRLGVATVISVASFFGGNVLAHGAEVAVLSGADPLGIANLPTLARIVIAGGSSAGYYGIQFGLGAGSALLAGLKGWPPNILGAATYYASPHLPRIKRILYGGLVALVPDFGIEVYYLIHSGLVLNPDLYTAVNTTGIVFTAAQVGATGVMASSIILKDRWDEKREARKAAQLQPKED